MFDYIFALYSFYIFYFYFITLYYNLFLSSDYFYE